jgi:hypothetical protein
MEVREEKDWGAGCVIVGIGLALLPVLYVLSVGPAWWLANKVPATNDSLRAFYSPLGFFHEYQTLGRILDWYMSLWA